MSRAASSVLKGTGRDGRWNRRELRERESDEGECEAGVQQGHLYGQLAVRSCAARELNIAGHVVAIAAHEILNLVHPPRQAHRRPSLSSHFPSFPPQHNTSSILFATVLLSLLRRPIADTVWLGCVHARPVCRQRFLWAFLPSTKRISSSHECTRPYRPRLLTP